MKNRYFIKPTLVLAILAGVSLTGTEAYGQIINTIAGTGSGGFSGDSGPATAAQFRNPSSAKFDTSGNLYVADYNNHRIRKISPSGIVSTIAGTGVASYSGDGGPATAAALNSPVALALDIAGNLYFSDRGNNRIRKVSTTGVITTIAGTGAATYTGDGGAATAATINYPGGLNTDAAGNIYLADENNSVIRKIDVSSGIITTIAGTGATTYSGDGGAATAAELNKPKDVYVAASGEIYIADYNNNRVRKISTSGIITTVAGTGTAGFSGDGGSALGAQISHPLSVWVDAAGDILFSDSWNNRVRKINYAGTITTFAGDGLFGYSGDGGPATAAALRNPTITADGVGNVYLAEDGSHRIRKITPAPVTLSGTPHVCEGNSITLTGSVSGGTWSSSATSIATVDASGNVTGVAAGSATISYTAMTGTGTLDVTVFPTPAAITGTTSVCVGATTTLSSTSTGGNWASLDPATATIDASGTVTGVAADTVTIGYGFATGCYTTTVVTVNSCPVTVSSVNKSDSYTVLPNPSNGSFTVKLPDTKAATITITDLTGRRLQQLNSAGKQNIPFDQTQLAPGTYMLSISSEQEVHRTKILITK